MLRLVTRSFKKINFKRFNSTTSKGKKDNGVDATKQYIAGTCVTGTFIITSGILYYRRRSENQRIHNLVDTITFDDFIHKYLLEGKVSSIIYHSPFSVGDVYLKEVLENPKLSGKEKLKSELALLFFKKDQQIFTRPPDIRFEFDKDSKLLSGVIHEINKSMKEINGNSHKDIQLTINKFPTKEEFTFLGLTTAVVFVLSLLV